MKTATKPRAKSKAKRKTLTIPVDDYLIDMFTSIVECESDGIHRELENGNLEWAIYNCEGLLRILNVLKDAGVSIGRQAR
jgi:hypothetical protein